MAKTFRTGIIIEGDAKGGIRAVRAAEGELKSLDRQQRRNSDSAKRMAAQWRQTQRVGKGLAIGAAAAATGVLALAARQAAAAKESDALAQSIGISTQSLMEWQYAGERVGINAEKMGDIFKDTSDKLGDFIATGGGEAADLFENLNLNLDELRRMKPDEQLIRIGEAIGEVNDRSQQVFYLESIADDASRLLPLLDNNAAKLKALKQEARDLGVAPGQEDIDKLKAANAAIVRMQGAMRGLGNDIAIAVAPAMADAVGDMDYLRDIIGDAGFQQNLATMAKAFATTAGFLAEGMREYVTLGEQLGTITANLAGYSNELEDIDKKIQRLESMRDSSSLSRAGLFNFAGEFDTYIDDADIDRYIAKLKARRAQIASVASESGAAGKGDAGALEGFEVNPTKYQKLIDQYDEQHAKLMQLRDDRRALQRAMEEDPANADAYRRSLAEVNRQIESLGRNSSASAKQLTAAYESTYGRLQEQLSLQDEAGQAARVRYEIERGALRGISAARERSLMQMAQEVDALDAQRAAVQALFPEFEQLQRIKSLSDATGQLPEGMQGFGRRRADDMLRDTALGGLPQMQGLDPMYNGPFGEAQRLEGDRANYQAEYEKRREAFQVYAEQHKEDAARAHEALEILEQDHQKRMLEYDQQTARARREGYAEMFGSMTDIVGTFAGEQSGIYKTMFAAEKAYHLASVIMSSSDAIAKAWASAPFPANLPAVATTAAQTGVLSAAVSSVSMSGQAHDGIDNVPNTGTWNLERGERVIDRRTNVDLKQYLQRENSGGNAGAPSLTINMPITVEGQAGQSEAAARRQGQQIGEQVEPIILRVIDNQFRPGGRFENVKRTG